MNLLLFYSYGCISLEERHTYEYTLSVLGGHVHGAKCNENKSSSGPLIETITPVKPAAFPDEIADCIVFLNSPSASYINGTALPIDGGLTLPAPSPLPM